MSSFWIPLLAGAATGVLSAWGIGGGTLSVPFMSFCNVPLHHAVGTSAAIGFPIAVAGTLGYIVGGWNAPGLPTAGMGLLYHRKNGLLDRELLRRTVPWGLLAAAGGALLASIIDVTLLRRIFGIYLLAAGVSMLLPSKKG